MPRLSIIVPSRQNDSRLEMTLVSVLQNRPEDSEVIVVHDGSYRDPYALGDEVIFVEADQGSSTTELINAGLMAACSPTVHTLLDGVEVTAGWADGAAALLENDRSLASIASVVGLPKNQKTCGLGARQLRDARALRTGQLYARTTSAEVAGAELTSGFFRRSVLLALGGFDASLDPAVAAVNHAWAISELGLGAAVDPQSLVYSDSGANQLGSTEQLQQLGALAVAYGRVGGGASAAAGELLRGILSARPLAAIAWCQGLMSSPRHSVEVRLSNAKQQLAERTALQAPPTDQLRIFAEDANATHRSGRRAA